MSKILLVFTFLACCVNAFSQADYEQYWQQKTAYKIEASLDTETDILSGHEQLIYYNNSPHQINELYFHLYQNAFQPGSYFDRKQKAEGNPVSFGRYESMKKGMEVSDISVDNQEVSYTIDNTILEIVLNKPLMPGDSLTVKMNFKTYFDIEAGWRRMRVFEAYGAKNYNGAHWYPRISVFDRKFGWTADQHMVHEFYGDFGTYDVTLNLPAHYITDATGLLQNRSEVLPRELREKLDIQNFKDKPLYSEPSIITEPTKEMKSWHFKAENVHDFAFVASPLFRIGQVEWNGIICRSLAMEPHAARWQDAASLTAAIISIYSRDFGMYAYPKMIVADVQSGMEYPMLTMNNGISPGYAYIFAHEIGHNWFFGAVGSNETYRGLLDEGFTQFLTNWALEELSAKKEQPTPVAAYFPEKYRQQHDLRYKNVFKGYYEDAFYNTGTRLTQHSDKFDTPEPYGTVYRQTYYKAAAMLYNLKFVLGDSLFLSCMKHYYNTWKFRHPYVEDMRKAFINHSGVELNWFFDQWLNSRKTIDYGIKKVKNRKDTSLIILERKGRMEMPVNVMVITKNNDSTMYHIPNRNFVKETKATVLKKWYGWDRLNKEYTIAIPGEKIKQVIIDPQYQISDINRLNNSNNIGHTVDFDFLIRQPENIYAYNFYARPDFWWNNVDGVKAGVYLDGNYMKELHKFSLSVLYHTQLFDIKEKKSKLPVSWNISYMTRISKAPSKAYLDIRSKQDLGWSFNRISLFSQNKENTYGLSFTGTYMSEDRAIRYAPDNTWDTYAHSHPYIYMRAFFQRDFKGGFWNAGINSATGYFVNSAFDFTVKKTFRVGKLDLRTRGYARYNLGSDYIIEDALLLSGANAVSFMDNRLARSTSLIPDKWITFGSNPNHFHLPGGLNIRGYSGYLSGTTSDEGKLEHHHFGNTGMAVNGELSMLRVINPVPRFLKDYLNIDMYGFYDAGIIDKASISKLPRFKRVYMDAGVGVNFTVTQWWKFDKLKPVTLRVDMPLFLNIKPYSDESHFKFRWMLGLEKVI